MNPFGKRNPILTACLWMAGTLVSFMAMAIGGRQLSAHLSTFQILFFRSLTGLFIITPILLLKNRRLILTRYPGLHLIRNISHFGGQFGWFYGIAYISLAKVFAIEFTLPVWTALLAALILKEKLTRPRILAVVFGVTGMLIILRPGAGVITIPALAVLAGAVCYGLSHTLTKKISAYDPPLVILFYMTLIQLPLGFIFSVSDGIFIPVPLLPWMLVVGITALSGHFCMAKAFTLAPATVVVPMDFLRLPLIAAVGFIFYSEPIDGFVLFGALVMLTGNLINIRAEQKTT